MQITAALLLVTTAVASPGQSGSTQPPPNRPHQVGIGSSISVSNRGAGGAVRYWFGERVGVSVSAIYYRSPSYARSYSSSTFSAAPSVLVMLAPQNQTRDIDLRPYVGAGLSYVRATRSLAGSGLPARQSGTGGQAFAGAEITFREAPNFTISIEGVYYRLPVRFVNADVVDGFNMLMGVHIYLK